jgi:nucleotide-binding universal stress UspA family protein
MNRILVCIDGSRRAPLVLETAADLARRTGAKLRVFRAVGIPAEIDQEVVAHAAMGMIETMLDKARREVAELCKLVPSTLVEGIDVRIGVPWDAICREAKDRECELIVIGSHGYSGLDRILGTTAAKVVNHASCSVLVVR